MIKTFMPPVAEIYIPFKTVFRQISDDGPQTTDDRSIADAVVSGPSSIVCVPSSNNFF